MSTPNDAGKSADFEHLVSLLEFEVNRLETAWSRSGWSLWALLAGLATTLWLVSLELEHSTPTLSNVLFLSLVYSLFFESSLIFMLLGSPASPVMPGRFVGLSPYLLRSRPGLLLEIFRNVILFFITVHIANVIPLPYRVIIYGYLIIFTLLNIAILGLSLVKVNLSTPMPSGKPLGILLLVLLLPVLISSFGLFRVLWLGQVSPTLQEWRLGGLFAAAYLILYLLVRGQRQTPLLQSLVEMRRSIALGQLDLESATRQVDIALKGMTTSDVFQSDLARMLAGLERGTIHLECAHKEIQACLQLTPGADKNKQLQTRELAGVTLNSVNNHLRISKELLDSFSLRLNSVRQRVQMYGKLSGGNVQSELPLENKLRDLLQAFIAKKDVVLAERADLERRFIPVTSKSQVPNDAQ